MNNLYENNCSFKSHKSSYILVVIPLLSFCMNQKQESIF